MANFAIVNLGIKADKLQAMLNKAQKESGWVNLTMFISDEADNYGNNASVYVQQSKEERIYVANGKVSYVSDGFQIAKPGEAEPASDSLDDLPF